MPYSAQVRCQLHAMKIEGRVFVVTGGASGLGEATCRELVSRGGKVAILDRDEDLGKQVAGSMGEVAAFFSCDVMSEESITTAVEAVMAKFGRIDGNINCAGGGPPAPVVNKKGKPVNMQFFEMVVRLNLLGSVSVLSKCVAKMMANEPTEDGERGCVINVASVAAWDGQNGQAAYSAAKGGIVSMALPMARDLGTRGVRVNVIAPGVFDTAMTTGFREPDGKLTRVGDSLMKQQVFPNKRFGNAKDFAHMACAIIENVMLNGETIRLDAGIRMPKL